MVLDVQEYTQKDGRVIEKVICKNGFFYIDKDDIDIIEHHTFEVLKAGGQTTLTTPRTSIKQVNGKYKVTTFANCLVQKYNINTTNCILDHKNGLEIDNIKPNLCTATVQQNGYNQFSQGYTINKAGGKNGAKHTNFFATIKVKNLQSNKCSIYRPFGAVRREDVVAKQQNYLENDWLFYNHPNVFYPFTFTDWRRNDIDILVEEREGRLSKNESIKAFLMQPKYKDNPWYWCRYDLFSLYQTYGVTYPVENKDWYIDENGMMRFENGDFCRPFSWGINVARVN